MVERLTPYGIFIFSIGDIRNLRTFQTKVYVFGQLYCFTDIFTAFDFCFKTFFALNVQYPKISAVLWYIVQKLVYNKCHTDDNNNLSTTAEILIKKMKLRLPNFFT